MREVPLIERVVGEGICEELAFGQRFEGEELAICRVSIPGRRNSICKGPRVAKTELYRVNFWSIGIGQP